MASNRKLLADDHGQFYQALTSVSEIAFEGELGLKAILEKINAAASPVKGGVIFYCFAETSMNLEGIDRYQRLIISYQKLYAWRTKCHYRSSKCSTEHRR
ncbi:hypothetical protein [Kushneria sp. AK178]